MWKNPKYFYVSYVSTKSYGICFISPIKQPELTNFLLAFWLKNTFHFPLSWLSMVPIFINCVKKKFKTYVPRLCYSRPLWGSTEKLMRGVMQCHSLNKISSIRQQDLALWCLLPTSMETKERIPKQAIRRITV